MFPPRVSEHGIQFGGGGGGGGGGSSSATLAFPAASLLLRGVTLWHGRGSGGGGALSAEEVAAVVATSRASLPSLPVWGVLIAARDVVEGEAHEEEEDASMPARTELFLRAALCAATPLSGGGLCGEGAPFAYEGAARGGVEAAPPPGDAAAASEAPRAAAAASEALLWLAVLAGRTAPLAVFALAAAAPCSGVPPPAPPTFEDFACAALAQAACAGEACNCSALGGALAGSVGAWAPYHALGARALTGLAGGLALPVLPSRFGCAHGGGVDALRSAERGAFAVPSACELALSTMGDAGGAPADAVVERHCGVAAAYFSGVSEAAVAQHKEVCVPRRGGAGACAVVTQASQGAGSTNFDVDLSSGSAGDRLSEEAEVVELHTDAADAGASAHGYCPVTDSRASPVRPRPRSRDMDAGDARAQRALGHMHYWGRGVPVDRARAFELFRAAAAQGDAEAMCVRSCASGACSPPRIAALRARRPQVQPGGHARARGWWSGARSRCCAGSVRVRCVPGGSWCCASTRLRCAGLRRAAAAGFVAAHNGLANQCVVCGRLCRGASGHRSAGARAHDAGISRAAELRDRT